jgi:hypothetical protein
LPPGAWTCPGARNHLLFCHSCESRNPCSHSEGHALSWPRNPSLSPTLAFNPLAPILGGMKKRDDLRDTLKLPAALRCTVACHSGAAGNPNGSSWHSMLCPYGCDGYGRILLGPSLRKRDFRELRMQLCRAGREKRNPPLVSPLSLSTLWPPLLGDRKEDN